MTVGRTTYVVILGVILTAGGCGPITNTGTRNKQTRPIVIVLHDKHGSCDAAFGKKPQHAFKGDTIAWEFINTCDAAQTVTLSIKSGSSNPFTDAPPWTNTVKANDDADRSLAISDTVQPGTYGFDISVGGKKFDPKLEIDP